MADKKIEGKIDQVEGKVRVAVGKVTGKKSTELKGQAQKAMGKVKEQFS